MRICFTSDLHGLANLYDQLTRFVRAEKPDLLILGGDLLPDGRPDDPVRTQVAYLEDDLIPRIQDWHDRFPGLAVACLVGNHEWLPSEDVLRAAHQTGTLALLTHEAPWEFAGLRFLGYGCTPPTPHAAKDFERRDLPDSPVPPFGGVSWDAARHETRDAELVEHFARHASIAEDLAKAPPVADPWILVAHAPPYDSGLDRLPEIDHPVGSMAVRAFILERQPLVSLHGHVHQAPYTGPSYFVRLGRTLCINPGQDEERLHAAVFDADRPEQTLRHSVLS